MNPELKRGLSGLLVNKRMPQKMTELVHIPYTGGVGGGQQQDLPGIKLIHVSMEQHDGLRAVESTGI